MDVLIGTSGYSYPDWVGDFYPTGTKPAGMLPIYARSFPIVELNFTFYRPPTPVMLERIAEKVPTRFCFLVKLPRTISHEASREDLPTFRRAAETLAERHQLAGLLCQLPQSAHNKTPMRQWLRSLARELGHLDLAVEFRHHSWAVPEVPAWLADLGVDLVAVDAPDLPGLYPSGWVQSGPRAYVRLHSRNSGNWYSKDGGRYDYNYSDTEMGQWVEALIEAAPRTQRTLLLFNNCQLSQAAHNAKRLQVLLQRQASAADIHIVEPPAPVQPVQGTLFPIGRDEK
jgi:uncharacterized protein YecE (DUF72 family)